jgi:nucleolar pre-ribosomal-associated protein 1
MDEFRPHGIRLCKTLLQPTRLKLIARNLTANNEYIISPSLRLLTEVVSFDGGSQANSVIARREFTFKGLGRNLKWVSTLRSSDKREPVRTVALRYLLANFKFQNSSAKSDLAGQRDIISALFKNIRNDPPDIVVNILNVLKQDFVLDDGVQRSAKSRLLSPWALARLASLYGYTEPTTDDGNSMEKSVESAAHEFLLFVCTTPGLGVLLPDLGWYPPGSSMSNTEFDKETGETQDVNSLNIRLELDQLEESKYREKIPVRNSTLSAFAQELRPHANTLQSELLIAVFKAAPELVADYYLNRQSSFESKLNSTWIGCAAFLFSTVQLPVPKSFSRQESFSNRPPPIPIVIENILPRPLNQKVLTKCLNQNTKLIKFFAIRVLCEAFQKLEVILGTFSSVSARNISIAWKQASSGLLQEFCRRCPKMKDIITIFRSMDKEDILQREAVARLLAMYYRVVPEIALNERFDVSISLGNILKRIEVDSDTAEDLGMRMLELEHLLYVAQCSPDIRWWNKPGRPIRPSPQYNIDANI